ncbi:MAG TPA: hypothetical protein DCX89_09095 [Saprospirales bacterium]|nr:hypothetical protein [Saprospirales bacterium]HAY72032.1 hypothetical protein [Saprospirales bacterium]HRQ28724.1 hypothetical protein [Saprospiraceae bacterium]
MNAIRFFWLISLLSLVSVLQGQTGYGTGQHGISVQFPSIVLLDIEPGDHTVNLEISAPTEAGNPVTIGSLAADNTLWMNYTSALSSSASSRSVTVQLMSGSVPSGLRLRVQANTYSGTGAGTFGTPGGTINISGTAQNLLTGIRGAYTGNGVNTGHRLTYSLQIQNYGQLAGIQTGDLTIAYTITQN